MTFTAESDQSFMVNIDSAQEGVRALGGVSEEAFFQAHAQAVYAYALRRVNDPSTAEDITADVFLQAIQLSKSRSGHDLLP